MAALLIALGGMSVVATVRAEPSAILHRFADGPATTPAGWAGFVNPAAPKGGALRLVAVGTFDSFNPFALAGTPAAAVDYTLDTMMAVDPGDPLVRHCLVCETVEVSPDGGWMEFKLRPAARFHDGSPVSAADVAWTIEALKAHGHPYYRAMWRGLVGVAARDGRTIRLHIADDAPAGLPLMLAGLPIQSRAWWEKRQIGQPISEPPLGSGPYRIAAYELGRRVTLRRATDHWAADHPLNRGRFNFDVIQIDYYRDPLAARESFFADAYDARLEADPRAWAEAHQAPVVQRGLVRLAEIPEARASGMNGFVLNTRRPHLADRRVRAAMTYAFDFDLLNRLYFANALKRTRSYFNQPPFAADGAPSPGELALLRPLSDRLPPEVFASAWTPPATDGSGDWRGNRRIAMGLLREAGYTVREGRLQSPDGRPVAVEILLADRAEERIALFYAENLRRLGFSATVRTVDLAQYHKRLALFDFDVAVALLGQSEAPGVEQRYFWSSAEASAHGGINLAGVRDAAVDALIERVVAASDMDALVAGARALDRALAWGYYCVPLGHANVDRVAYWDRLGRPERQPRYGVDLTTWWLDPAKDAALRDAAGR